MDDILDTLILNLQRTKNDLQAPAVQRQLDQCLHNNDPGALPDSETFRKSLQAVDLLHEIKLMLDPGHLVLSDHFFGYARTKSLVAAVDLGVADHLKQHGSMTVSELASRCDAKPLHLHQILRLLISNGIFQYDAAPGKVANNQTSELLCEKQWAKHWVSLYGNQFYDIARGIPASIKNSEARTAAQVEANTDEDIYTYFYQKGWFPQFHRALAATAVSQGPGILADYPWQECSSDKILDIAGGTGALIALLLRAYPNMRGAIFDMPSVIPDSKAAFHSPDGQFADVGDRVAPDDIVGGDFFQRVPAAKIYTMKWVLHNWAHDNAVAILRNIRSAIVDEPGARLVVLDSVLGLGHSDRLSRYADITMMMSIDALERTREEWEALAREAGWIIAHIYRLRNAWPCAIDMRPA